MVYHDGALPMHNQRFFHTRVRGWLLIIQMIYLCRCCREQVFEMLAGCLPWLMECFVHCIPLKGKGMLSLHLRIARRDRLCIRLSHHVGGVGIVSPKSSQKDSLPYRTVFSRTQSPILPIVTL